MAEQMDQDFLIFAMIRREWFKKTRSFETAVDINEKFKNQLITPDEVQFYYSQLDKGETLIFCQKSPLLVFSTQGNGTKEKDGKPKNLHNSLLMLDEDESYKSKMFTSNGRFLVSHSWSGVGVQDLFQGTKKKTPIKAKHSIAGSGLVGQQDTFLLFKKIRQQHEDVICWGFVIKIDYNTLSITSETHFEHFHRGSYVFVVSDQLDRQNFIVGNNFEVRKCQIGNDDEFQWSDERFPSVELNFGVRLMGNKLQGFVKNQEPLRLKFCEIDLETKEKTEMEISTRLPDGTVLGDKTPICCWSQNRFYAMYPTENQQHNLFAFNFETLKWIDVKISVPKPLDIFIDDNEILTLRVGTNKEEARALYRIALRTPEKLENLTRFTAVRQSSLYGNEKYINAARQIQIKD